MSDPAVAGRWSRLHAIPPWGQRCSASCQLVELRQFAPSTWRCRGRPARPGRWPHRRRRRCRHAVSQAQFIQVVVEARPARPGRWYASPVRRFSPCSKPAPSPVETAGNVPPVSQPDQLVFPRGIALPVRSRLPNSAGISPVNWLLERSRCSRLVRLPNSAGISRSTDCCLGTAFPGWADCPTPPVSPRSAGSCRGTAQSG